MKILFSFFLLVSMLYFSGGCTRKHYRVKADKEVYSLLATGGTHDPRWKLDDYRISVDRRSRMYNTHDPDTEPMPPDDPTAHRKMVLVDGKKASKHWNDNGRTQCVENPSWRDYLLFNERGVVALDKDGAVEMGLLHSPEYQAALENLYLSAIQVSKERFRFDVQFYGGESLFYTARGRLRETNGTRLNNSVDIEAQKLFATGGELVVGLANSVTWTFSGKNDWHSSSIFNFALMQPLLRNAGRKIVLENLTQSERDFLAAIRQMVFFQQGFYTKIVTGSGAQSMPSGSIGSGSTPQFSDGFYGLLAEQIKIQNQRQNIVSLEENYHRFSEFFEAGALQDKYQVERTRDTLLNSESSLLTSIASYETKVDTFLRSLGLPPDMRVDINDRLIDRFQLSSPALTRLQDDLNVLLADVRNLDQPLPDGFNKRLEGIRRETEGELKGIENDLSVLEQSIPERVKELQALETSLGEELRRGERIDASIYDAKIFQERIQSLKEHDIPRNLDRIRAAFVLVDLTVRTDEPELRQMIRENRFDHDVRESLQILEIDRLMAMDRDSTEATSALKELEETDQKLEEIRRLYKDSQTVETQNEKTTDVLDTLKDELDRLRIPKTDENTVIAQKPQDPWTPDASSSIDRSSIERRQRSKGIVGQLSQKDEYRDWVRRILSAFQNEILSLSIAQTRIRLDSITLSQTMISSEEALQIASENRLDWMNRRARLVDDWRQIEIAANKLRGELNVKVEGELGTVDKKGVRFDGDNGQLRVGFEWDTPLTRHNEMLDYRKAQIQYQAARREYYTYVDSVNADLRRILRNVRNNQVNFENKRLAIHIAANQVGIMQLNLSKPPARGSTIDPSTATNLIDALNSLLSRQNEFLDIWVAYQTQRMLLDMNMGTMQLDENGRWIDPGVITKDRKGRVEFAAERGALTPSKRSRSSKSRAKTISGDSNVSVSPPPAPRLDGEDVPMLAPPVIKPATPEMKEDSKEEPMSLEEKLKETSNRAAPKKLPPKPAVVEPVIEKAQPKTAARIDVGNTAPQPGPPPKYLKQKDAPPPPKLIE